MKTPSSLFHWLHLICCAGVFLFLPTAGVHAADLVIGDTPGETVIINSGTSYSHTGNIYVVGTGTLMVEGELRLNGTISVRGLGNFTVDGGEFHLLGDYTNIAVSDHGRVVFRNDALLHYV